MVRRGGLPGGGGAQVRLLRRTWRRRGRSLDGCDNLCSGRQSARCLVTSVASSAWLGREAGELAAAGFEGILVLPGVLNQQVRNRDLGPREIKLLLSTGKAVLENEASLSFLLWKTESDCVTHRVPGSSGAPHLSPEPQAPRSPDGRVEKGQHVAGGRAPIGVPLRGQECSGRGRLSSWKEITRVESPLLGHMKRPRSVKEFQLQLCTRRELLWNHDHLRPGSRHVEGATANQAVLEAVSVASHRKLRTRSKAVAVEKNLRLWW